MNGFIMLLALLVMSLPFIVAYIIMKFIDKW